MLLCVLNSCLVHCTTATGNKMSSKLNEQDKLNINVQLGVEVGQLKGSCAGDEYAEGYPGSTNPPPPPPPWI